MLVYCSGDVEMFLTHVCFRLGNPFLCCFYLCTVFPVVMGCRMPLHLPGETLFSTIKAFKTYYGFFS